jgi:density-regulated protein
VIIKRIERNKRKHITAVNGLEAFGVDLKKAAKQLAKEFATGASVTKNAAGQVRTRPCVNASISTDRVYIGIFDYSLIMVHLCDGDLFWAVQDEIVVQGDVSMEVEEMLERGGGALGSGIGGKTGEGEVVRVEVKGKKGE